MFDTLFGQTEIREKRMALLVQDYIVGLQVSVDDVSTVQRLKSEYDLANEELGFPFREYVLYLYVLVEVAAGTVVAHEEQFVARLEGVAEPHDEGVPHLCHYVALGYRILPQNLLIDLSLAKYFHGKLLLVCFSLDKIHFPERAVSEQLLSYERVRSDRLV